MSPGCSSWLRQVGLGTRLGLVISGGSGQEKRQGGTGWVLTNTLFLRNTPTRMCSSQSTVLHDPFPLPGALNARDAAIVSGGNQKARLWFWIHVATLQTEDRNLLVSIWKISIIPKSQIHSSVLKF